LNWSYVLAAFGCLFVVGLLDNSRGPLFPDVLAGLRLSDAEGAWLFAAASAAGGVGSVLGRHLLARVRPLRGLQAGLLTATAGVYLLGTSASLDALVAGSALFGLSFGLLSLVQGTLVQRGAPPATQRRVFSGLHSMYGAASFLSPLVVIAASRGGLDWRGTFRLLACAPLALLVLSFVLREPDASLAGAVARPPEPQAKKGERWREVLVGLAAGLYVAAELAISTRLVLHLQRQAWTPDHAKAALMTFFACLLTGRVAMGVLTTSLSHRKVLALSAGLSLVATTLGLLVHPAFLCLAGLTMAPFFPVSSALVADEFPGAFERAMSTLLALVCVCVMSAHWLIGRLSDLHTLHAALAVSPVCLAGVLALIVVTAPTQK
jgi:MFS transporter, FHS family, glucose/mannose:H+ symporter